MSISQAVASLEEDNSSIFFFTSPIGLGHATRDIAIADRLRRLGSNGDSREGSQRSIELFFASGGPAASMISGSGYNVLDVYRPNPFDVQLGELRNPMLWLIRYYSYYRECKRIAKEILSRHSTLTPVVSDEDFASIAVAENMHRKLVLVTDITETRFLKGPASIVERQMNKSLASMMKKCDIIIIPDLGQDTDNIVYVGPIVRECKETREELRKKFGFKRNTIVVTIGGTDAGRYLVERAIEAYGKVRENLDADLVIVQGPSMLNLPQSPGIRGLGFVDNLHEYIYAADLVVSLAGRSTIDETKAYDTPGIFIPIKGHFEQEHGAAKMGYKFEDIFRLDSLMLEKLGKRNTRNGPSSVSQGAEKAARLILQLLS